MRKALLLFLLAVPLAAAAASVVYRWVDANGVVHYSDQPHPGAVKVNLGAPSVVDFKSSPSSTPAPGSAPAPPQQHYQVKILAPADGTTLRPADWKVAVSVNVRPPLGKGAALRYALDGKQIGKPTPRQHVTLTQVYRGTHHLTVTVLGAGGTARGQASSTFYVHHHSILSHRGGSPRGR